MLLSKARKAYEELSGTASTITRQLAFAGIALVWVFRSPAAGAVVLPTALRLPTMLLILGLALDLLQYAIGSIVWGGFARIHEKRAREADPEVTAPAWLNWPALICFWSKVAVVGAANILLLRFAIVGVSFGR